MAGMTRTESGRLGAAVRHSAGTSANQVVDRADELTDDELVMVHRAMAREIRQRMDRGAWSR